MFVKTVLRRPPCLQRATGHMKRLGGLTQGEPLGLQIAILIEESSASGAIPSWGKIIMASWFILFVGAYINLLVSSFAFVLAWLRMARSPTRFNPARCRGTPTLGPTLRRSGQHGDRGPLRQLCRVYTE